MEIYDALHNLVSFVQIKKGEKHPWRSVNFRKWFSSVFRGYKNWNFEQT